MGADLSPSHHEQQAVSHLAAVEVNPLRDDAAIRVAMAQAHATLAQSLRLAEVLL